MRAGGRALCVVVCLQMLMHTHVFMRTRAHALGPQEFHHTYSCVRSNGYKVKHTTHTHTHTHTGTRLCCFQFQTLQLASNNTIWSQKLKQATPKGKCIIAK